MSEKAIEVLQSVDYHSMVPDFLPVSLQNVLHDFIDEFDVYKVFRIMIIVYFYMIFRRTYTNYAKRKQVEKELQLDEQRKQQELANPTPELVEESNKIKDDQSWGWGKRTRRNIKKQEEVLVETLKELEERSQGSAYNPDSDDDIEELLED